MIFPWLRGFQSWQEAPLTWVLIGLNIFIFFLTFQSEKNLSNLNYQDFKYAARSYSLMKGQRFPSDSDQRMILGAQAVRDRSFFENYRDYPPTTDVVALAQWHENLQNFESSLKSRQVDVFGLHGREKHWLSLITYQFMHSGLTHLISNMVLFLIFGAAVEALVGSLILVFLYLCSGIAGAFLFLFLSPDSSAPMVGASAALTGVMAFYIFFEVKKRVRFFYFIAPQAGYWGEIFLPTFLMIPLFFIDDIVGLTTTPEALGAPVAHGAHLGGALCGAVLAVIIRTIVRRYPQLGQSLCASYSQSQPEAP